MNKNPLNYIITTLLGILIWVVFAVFVGDVFANSIDLANQSPEEFLVGFRIVLLVATVSGILSCVLWYYYGSKDSSASEPNRAKKIWFVSFTIELLVAVVLLLIVVFINLDEGLVFLDYLVILLMLAACSAILFWFSTFFMSPKSVKYIPLFKS